MWHPERELLKKAAVIASDKNPNGFTKKQLIDASKEVYGGYGANPNKKIKTKEDINNMGNYMSEIDGHYPRGMSGCYIVGIRGQCGIECPVYLDGQCEDPQEFNLNPGDEGYELHKELYL